MTTIGWIGVGAMGQPMARRAAASGFSVNAFDVSAERLAASGADGVATWPTVAEATRGSDVVVVMVATPDQGESVLFGGDRPELVHGTDVVVMSTVGPRAIESWAERLAPSGVTVVDAPVSGGVVRAAAGQLLTMVGAADAPFERCSGLLDALCARVVRIGPNPGDGQRMKVVNQLLCGVHIAVAAEALGLAKTLGLDLAASWEILCSGAAQSFMLENRGERMVASAFDEPFSAIDIFVKDLGLVRELASSVEYPTPIAETARAMFEAGHRAGFGRLDDSAVLRVALGEAGTRE